MKTYNPEKYWDGRFRKGFNLEAVGFDSFGKSFNRQQYRMKRKVLEKIVTSHIKCLGNRHVLDIGCGTGFYVDAWKEWGIKNLVGIDIASQGIKRLSKRFPLYKFYKSDISSPTLVGSKFEIITVFDVLYHIVDDKKFEQAIKNIRKLCADNALILITDIFPHKRPYILKHQKSRTLENYEQVLQRNGIEIVSRVPVHCLLNAPLDVSNSWLQWVALSVWWKLVVGGMQKLTHLPGFIFYMVDTLLLGFMKESISTEMMVCRPMVKE